MHTVRDVRGDTAAFELLDFRSRMIPFVRGCCFDRQLVDRKRGNRPRFCIGDATGDILGVSGIPPAPSPSGEVSAQVPATVSSLPSCSL